jgi:hypothetical protein
VGRVGVTTVSSLVSSPVRRHGVTARRKAMVEVRPGRGETGGPPGEAREAGPVGAVRGAEGETQSGVVKVDSRLRGKVH